MLDGELFSLTKIEKRGEEKPRTQGRCRPRGRPFDSKITVRKTAAGWQLCTDGACGVLPAGSRLLRHKPWPVDRFMFEDKDEAIKAGQVLAEYLQTEFVE